MSQPPAPLPEISFPRSAWERTTPPLRGDYIATPLPRMKPTSPIRVTAVYSGRVQGVGFRYTARSIARGYDVTGYVANLPDGRVELVAEGDRPQIDAFLAEVRDHFFNHIRDERRDTQAASGEFTGFDIRH